jgi:hypothetical protein
VFAHEPQQTALVIIINSAIARLDGVNIVLLQALCGGKVCNSTPVLIASQASVEKNEVTG